MFAIGTKRTWQSHLSMSAFRGIADIALATLFGIKGATLRPRLLSSGLCANQNHLNCTARRRTGRRLVVAQQLHRWEGHSVTRCETVAAHNNLIRIRAGAIRRIYEDREVLSWRSRSTRRSCRSGRSSYPAVSFIAPIALRSLKARRKCKCAAHGNYRNRDTHNLFSPHLSFIYLRLARDVAFSL